jgi:hypothetical protein
LVTRSFSSHGVDAARSTGACAGQSSSHQHQREMRTGRAGPWGSCAPLLVADYQPQDWSSLLPARAGFHQIFSGFSPAVCLTHDLPVNWPGLRVWSLYARSAGSSRARDHSATVSGSRPTVRNPSAHHQLVSAFTDVPHVSSLSSSRSLRPHHIGRSEKGWRYLISVMRCPT